MLLRNVDEPERFIGYGAQESPEAIDRWVKRDVCQDALARFTTFFDEYEIAW